MRYFGIDIGTTNTKAVLLNEDGALADRYTISSSGPNHGYGESAESWYGRFAEVMDYFSSRGSFQEHKVAGSVTAQGGSFAFLDSRFKSVSPVYGWTQIADSSVAEDMVRCFGEKRYYHLTGWPPHGWLIAAKLKEAITRKQIPRTASFAAAVPDFIYSQLTGKLVTDITSAQVSGMCNLEDGQWNREILNWIGWREEQVPEIKRELKVLFEDVPTRWGKISLVNGSFDQYAAMAAAGLDRDKGAMLGTGTSWVINGKSSKPWFDEEGCNIHPGQDVWRDSFGYIIGVELIGKGFHTLLNELHMDLPEMTDVETALDGMNLPTKAIRVDLEQKKFPEGETNEITIRRYMEWAGALTAFRLQRAAPVRNMDRLIMTGGAAKSRFWPQVIANLCDIQVEAVDFQELTAYGAALHAQAAVTGRIPADPLPACGASILYEPENHNPYRNWYAEVQEPAFSQWYSA